MTVSPWLVLAGGLLGAGLGSALLGHLDSRQQAEETEQAATDDQFAVLVTTLERQ
ncbi:hypothetical protein [Kitasatospora sp. NPDC127116]|uniref:hypothetical protein n=1 Tax=Kitasatospora sp. NPDC127116 TaxID=3345367 RepID=UPI00362CCCA9